MNKDITKLIPSQILESLSEESLKAIKDEFEQLVESAVQERVQVAVSSAEASYDTEVNEKLKELVESIETAHTIGLKKVVKHLKEKYNNKIQLIRDYYNRKVVNESNEFKTKLVEKVSRFLDDNLKEAMPIKSMQQAIRNNTAMELVETFRNILSVNDASMKESIRKPVLEGYKTIKKLNKQKQILAERNSELLQKNKTLETQALLESKLQGMPEDAKNHLRRVMKDADAKFINENFDYAYGIYKEQVAKKRKALTERTMAKRNNVQRPQVTRNMLVESRAKVNSTPTPDEVAELCKMLDSDYDY